MRWRVVLLALVLTASGCGSSKEPPPSGAASSRAARQVDLAGQVLHDEVDPNAPTTKIAIDTSGSTNKFRMDWLPQVEAVVKHAARTKRQVLLDRFEGAPSVTVTWPLVMRFALPDLTSRWAEAAITARTTAVMPQVRTLIEPPGPKLYRGSNPLEMLLEMSASTPAPSTDDVIFTDALIVGRIDMRQKVSRRALAREGAYWSRRLGQSLAGVKVTIVGGGHFADHPKAAGQARALFTRVVKAAGGTLVWTSRL
jgi:hypothetical protein